MFVFFKKTIDTKKEENAPTVLNNLEYTTTAEQDCTDEDQIFESHLNIEEDDEEDNEPFSKEKWDKLRQERAIARKKQLELEVRKKNCITKIYFVKQADCLVFRICLFFSNFFSIYQKAAEKEREERDKLVNELLSVLESRKSNFEGQVLSTIKK